MAVCLQLVHRPDLVPRQVEHDVLEEPYVAIGHDKPVTIKPILLYALASCFSSHKSAKVCTGAPGSNRILCLQRAVAIAAMPSALPERCKCLSTIRMIRVHASVTDIPLLAAVHDQASDTLNSLLVHV